MSFFHFDVRRPIVIHKVGGGKIEISPADPVVLDDSTGVYFEDRGERHVIPWAQIAELTQPIAPGDRMGF